MKKERIDKATKKHNEEIVERIKAIVGVRYDVDFPEHFGITQGNLANFKSQDTGTFYKKMAYFCAQHSVNMVWLITGAGDKFIQTSQDTPNTPRERELVSRLLYVLRRVPDEAIKSALINLIDHYPLKYSGVAQDSADAPVRDGGDRSK